MVGWHHWLSGHEFKQTQGDSVGQRSLVCYSSWGHKELDTIYRLNNKNRETIEDGAQGKGTEVTTCKQDWELVCRTSVQAGRVTRKGTETAPTLPRHCVTLATQLPGCTCKPPGQMAGNWGTWVSTRPHPRPEPRSRVVCLCAETAMPPPLQHELSLSLMRLRVFDSKVWICFINLMSKPSL